MHRSSDLSSAAIAVALVLNSVCAAQSVSPEKGTRGERVPDSAISPLVLEDWDVVRKRAETMPAMPTRGLRNGRDGRWIVPQLSAKTPSHSGRFAVVNEWGDVRIGIDFEKKVALHGAFAAGHGVAPARAMLAIGYLGGKEVARTKWMPLSARYAELKLDFAGIDRVEFLAVPDAGRMGFFALDDLRFTVDGVNATTVLDFEDAHPRQVLSATKYAGLVWENGSGYRAKLLEEQIVDDVVPAPKAPTADEVSDDSQLPLSAMTATAPRKWDDFVGVTQGEPGATLVPPDTHGCNGPNHFVAIVNANISAWEKATRRRVVNSSLGAFWGASGLIGDPRIVFDPHSQRYIAIATNFTGRTLFLAVSRTNNPAGAWYKFSFRADQGSDSGRWPDYPTLGVDARGIYTSAYMVGGGARMTIWAIDKAPLIAATPRVGTITAFRSLRYEGALQPCVTYGTPGVEWFISRASSTSLRLRRVTGALTAPRLQDVGFATVPSHGSPPSAPALGSSRPLSTIDWRLMNAVYRNGSIYTVHGVSVGGKAAVRWYQVTTSPVRAQQVGTITDPIWHYFYGSITADSLGNVGLGFSGSHAGVYASTFIAGRLASDPAGLTSAPELVAPGTGPWNRVDGAGRNRFGDYSHIDVDGADDCGFWTTQEYILRSNVWRTRVTRFGFESINYGTGLAGRNGVPSIRSTARPVIGNTTPIQISNSAGSATAGLLLIGLQRANVPVLGGTLLVNSLINVTLAIPPSGITTGLPIPNDMSFVCKPVDLQCVELDLGAPQQFSFTPGLELRPTSR